MGSVANEHWNTATVVLVLVVIVYWVWRAVEWGWWAPRRLERELMRELGVIGGRRYRPIAGDLVEEARLRQEANQRPMPIYSHDMAPRVFPLLHRTIKEQGKFSITWAGPMPRITVMDPDLIKEILWNKFGHFQKSRNPGERLLINGILSYEGEKWAMHRRILNPAFHLEKLKCMLPEFSTASMDLIKRWATLIGDQVSRELDIWPDIQNLSADAISRSAFGSNFEEGRRIFELLREQAQLVMQASEKPYIPGYRFLPTSRNLRMKTISREINGILMKIINKREMEIKVGCRNKNDLLGLLIESNLSAEFLTNQEVIEECKLFYFAGQETTSVLLTWTMILLCMYPEWQVKAREEVLQVFGKEKPTFEGIGCLKIMSMIFYEVLRLYPPVVLMRRVTYKSVKLGNLTLPPGVVLFLPVLFIHHDPEIWGEDAKVFKPDRFAEGVSKASKTQAQGVFFPFGGGPRICIGQAFALIEAKISLSTILQHFTFELSQSYIHSPKTVITLQPQHGAQMKLKKL